VLRIHSLAHVLVGEPGSTSPGHALVGPHAAPYRARQDGTEGNLRVGSHARKRLRANAERRERGCYEGLIMRWTIWGCVLVVGVAVLCGDQPAAQAQDDAALRSLKELYKRPPPASVENAALVELGRLLFWDPRVSASEKTACVTCHLPQLGWAVTEPR